MSVSNNVVKENLSKTFAVFLPQNRSETVHVPTQKEIKKDKFERKYGMLYTTGAVAVTAGVLYALHRGGKLTNIAQYMKQLTNRLSAKTLEKMKNSSSLNFLQKIRLNIAAGITNVLRNMQGLGNINPVKDIMVDRAFVKIQQKTPIKAKSFFDKITDIFINYGKKLAASKYNKPQADFNSFKTILNKAISEVEKLPKDALKDTTPSALAAKLREFLSIAEKEFNNVKAGFGTRFDGMVRILKDNSENKFVSAITSASGNTNREKFFNKVKELCEFIPTKEMKPYYNEIFAPLFSSKRSISNSVIDLHKTLSTSLDNIFYNKSLQNQELRQNYINLRDLLNKFLKPKKYNVQRASIRDGLKTELQKTALNFKKFMPESSKAKQVEELLSLVAKDSKGAVEEAASLLKILKNYNPELYKNLISARNKFQKSFNTAIDFETDKSYRKMLDFSLHSLSTDLFTQAAGIGTVGYIVANRKKTAKEKIPAVLKEGIPVAGGLLVAFLCNLRQVASGPGSLFLAVISGFALNRLGSIVSKKFVENEKTIA